MKIAIAFFGITRSLSYTIESIEKHILTPARKYGVVTVFCHFYKQTIVNNTRSGESGTQNFEEYQLLNPDYIQFELPGDCLLKWNYDSISKHGDNWNDDFASLKNLIHQLNSLHTVTSMMEKSNPDIVIFCRPDLLYQDSFEKLIKRACKKRHFGIVVAGWQWFGGINDRFAICDNTSFLNYGKRIENIQEYCSNTSRPLHAESLLRFVLNKFHISIHRVSLRASRVRLGGKIKAENFSMWKSNPIIDLLIQIKNSVQRNRRS